MLFPAERPIIRSKSYLLGLVLLMCGTAGAMLLGEQKIAGTHAFGIILAVSSGMFFACYGMAVRKYMEGVNSVVAFAVISQYTALAMVVLMIALGKDFGLDAPRMEGSKFALLLLSAIIGIALGHVLYYISIARLGVAVSAGVLQLHPFFVAVGSLLLFDEVLSWKQWLAGCIAVTGAILMLSVQRRISARQRIDEMAVAIAEGESGS